MNKFKVATLLAFAAIGCAHKPTTSPPSAAAADHKLTMGKLAIHSLAGCYLVDYGYTETEGIKRGYQRNVRVYDVNQTKSVKEWIFTEDLSPTHTRVQHILFATAADGKFEQGSELKHQAEDWEYGPTQRYDFTAPQRWEPTMTSDAQAWTRKITNLDDGLRYQCTARWKLDHEYPEWTCDNFSPIPGRETRDMARKDYNTLDRSTRILVYDRNWLERQKNTKIIYSEGKRTPLAKEVGKNWYVRLPDGECSAMLPLVEKRRAFWALLRDSWQDVFKTGGIFVEKPPGNGPPRFMRMMEIEEKYAAKNLGDEKVRAEARAEILRTIAEYRLESK